MCHNQTMKAAPRVVRAMTRIALVLVALVVGAAPPALASDDDACVADARACATIGPGGAALVARPGEGEARAALARPHGGTPFADAEYARFGDDEVGEQVVTLRLACAPHELTVEECAPPGWFAGAHIAPRGHDARAGSSSDMTSASGGYATRAGDHDVSLTFGAFRYWGLQYGYANVAAAGESQGFFGAMPLPLWLP